VPKKKYDPLWELVDEKVALQGVEPDADATCPYCHVTVHLGLQASAGEYVECGLCGGVSEVTKEDGNILLQPAEAIPSGQ
jgi:hypothetical protein